MMVALRLGSSAMSSKTGLDVAGDVLDRGQTAPGDDLFDVLRLVEGFLDRAGRRPSNIRPPDVW